MQTTPEANLMSFVPLLLLSVVFGFVGHYLAKDKGRPVLRWTILCLIPFVNFYCLFYLVGCTSLRLEEKLDQVLKALGQRQDYR
jgi:hypothetical protein